MKSKLLVAALLITVILLSGCGIITSPVSTQAVIELNGKTYEAEGTLIPPTGTEKPTVRVSMTPDPLVPVTTTVTVSPTTQVTKTTTPTSTTPAVDVSKLPTPYPPDGAKDVGTVNTIFKWPENIEPLISGDILAYEWVIAELPPYSDIVYSMSSRTNYVIYTHFPLKPNTTYYWRYRVRGVIVPPNTDAWHKYSFTTGN
jgi:hypothetical protein